MNETYNQLITQAQKLMSHSGDPVHDISHVKRVVKYTEMIQGDFVLSTKQKKATILAAWWHDTGRTITKKPSIVIMPFVDDLISAFMLAKFAILNRLFDDSVGLAIRIILCKSAGTGTLFTKILLNKKNLFLLNMVDDADKLDLLNPERTLMIHLMVENSSLYHYGYKLAIWWFLHTQELKLKTRAAKEYLKHLLQKFLSWLKQAEIFAWHIKEFGITWVNKNIERFERLLFKLSCAS